MMENTMDNELAAGFYRVWRDNYWDYVPRFLVYLW